MDCGFLLGTEDEGDSSALPPAGDKDQLEQLEGHCFKGQGCDFQIVVPRPTAAPRGSLQMQMFSLPEVNWSPSRVGPAATNPNHL